LNERVTIVAVLSWAGPGGSRTSWRDQEHHAKRGVGFPFLHDGPIGPMVRGTPTVVVFDKAGKAVAWRVGAYDWQNREIRALLETLMN
jgi:hypothetical protein